MNKSWWAGHRRVFRPWLPEPGLWLQFDWGEGPEDRRAAHAAVLRGAVLVPVPVLPTWDRGLPSLLGCLDATLRILGGRRGMR